MKVEVLLKAAVRLDVNGVQWWLSDGSALGCHRDGAFIPSDHDIDIGVWIEDLPKVSNILWGDLKRDRPHQVWRIDRGIKVDVHGHERDGDTVFFRLGNKSELRYVFPAYLFDSFEDKEFYGRPMPMPSPIEDYLTAHYGDWETPTSKWRWDQSPPCLRR
jgi:phosphorylcholine metabolism protein LicD